jgi:hypothetical protein
MHFLITTSRVRVTALHGTVTSYKIIYADGLSFFSDIFFVGNKKKKNTSV